MSTPTDRPSLPTIQPFAELARGPVASVYKAYDRATGEIVLLKALRPSAGADPERRARFAAEARLAAEVVHPNVVRVRHVDADASALVADWVEGRDLQALLDDVGALPPALAVYVAREAARGLAAVHAAGILHRDVKPANVLLGIDGSVRLTDFGLASLASDAAADGAPEVRGTLATLAPEIVRGDEPSARADLFSLGAVLAHALSGAPPFAAAGPAETLDAVLHHDPTLALHSDPRIPPALAELAGALLAKQPDARPASADATADALDGLLDAIGRAEASHLAAFLDDPSAFVAPLPTQIAAPERVHDRAAITAPRLARRRPRALWAAALAVAGLLVAFAVWPRGAAPSASGGPAPAAEPRDTVRILDPDTDSLGLPPDLALTDEPTEGLLAAPLEDPAPAAVVEPPAARTPEPAPDRPAPPERTPPTEPLPAPPARPGSLVLAAEPWATVRIDGREVGTTPLAPIPLAPGTYQVTFENPSFPTHRTTVRVESGAAARASISLWTLVARITLDVAPWARVVVDGTFWDTVPPQSRPLPLTPGDHVLRFEHPSLGTREIPLRVSAGERRTVRVRMADGGT